MTFDEISELAKCSAEEIKHTRDLASASSDDIIIHKALRSVDWSFSDRTSHSPLEALHPYPAKFISEIPNALLRCLPIEKGTAVLDPFCGSGTTLAECQKFNLPSVGIDLNPIACLISRVRTSPLPAGFEGIAEKVVATARMSNSNEVPEIPRLDHWFKSEVQVALARLKMAIDTVDDAEIRDVLELVFSSIVVRVSNQESDTRYAAIEKPITFDGVFLAFERATKRAVRALNEVPAKPSPALVIEADVLKATRNDVGQKIGLVITSPPYPNAYEYWLYHKYRMWWLKKDPIAVKANEIGARAHFFKKNHHTADDFARQMGGTLDLISSVISDGGFVCFVVGRSKIHGKIYDNARIIEEEGEKRGYSHFFEVERELSSKRKSFNLSHANIKKETIIVLRKGSL